MKLICNSCGSSIEESFYNALNDHKEENKDGYYNNESETEIILVFCPSCKKLLQVEIRKDNEQIISIEEN